MSKIQISTVEKTCNVQVIELNTYIVSKLVRAQAFLENAIAKKAKTSWNESANKRENIVDANGNQEYDYSNVSGKSLDEKVLSVLNELVEAFEE